MSLFLFLLGHIRFLDLITKLHFLHTAIVFFLFVCFFAVFGAFGVCSATMAPKITTGLKQIMMLHRTGIEGSRLAAIRYNYSKPCDRVYKALSNLQR